jgi:hypothetical protein
MVEATMTENEASAAAAVKKLLSAPVLIQGQAPISLESAGIKISKGFNRAGRNPKFNNDTIAVRITTPLVRNSNIADAVAVAAQTALNKIPEIRKETILVSPEQYLADIKSRMKELLDAAKEAGIPGSNIDYSQWKGLDPAVADTPIGVGSHAINLVEDSNLTTIRIQIPTDSKNPDAAMAKANEIAQKLRTRLPQIKQDLITHVKRKNYLVGIDDALQQRLDAHELEVRTQQQDNKWTSVFIEVRSPEQVKAKENPAEKTDADALKKSNLFVMIPNELNRKKLASRIALFEGQSLKQPTDYFLDVAGTQDVEIALKKVMGRLKTAKPELNAKIDELLSENVLKDREQWTKSPSDQEPWKRVANAYVSSKEPETLVISFDVAAGKGEEIISKLAAMNEQVISSATPDLMTKPIAELTSAELEQVAPQRATELSADQIAALPEAVRAQVMAAVAAQQQPEGVLAKIENGAVVAGNAVVNAAVAAEQKVVEGAKALGGKIGAILGKGPATSQADAVKASMETTSGHSVA